jgi:hypothetical protein
MIVPHERGTKTMRIKFSKTDDLEAKPIPEINKVLMPLLDENANEPKNEPQIERAKSTLENAA